MSAENFEKCLALTLAYEGGFVDSPTDPGRATMCGVTQAVYDAYRDSRKQARQSVRLSTPAERTTIYRDRYWDLSKCDALPSGVDLAVFDFAVNSGVSRAVKTLQAIVGVDVDGIVGKDTLSAVQAYCQHYTAGALSDALGMRRIKFMQSLGNYKINSTGWLIRASAVIDHSFDMARDMVPVAGLAVVTPKTYAKQGA